MLAISNKNSNIFANQPIVAPASRGDAGLASSAGLGSEAAPWRATKDEGQLELTGTTARLTRAANAFEPSALRRRRFRPPRSGVPRAERLELGAWHEGSLGDPMHKLLLVLAGQVDVEGGSGGWLVLPNHLIFVPAGRQFNLRTVSGTIAVVVHLDPRDAPWRHEGCWVASASTLAHEMIAYALRLDPDRDAARQAFRMLSHMCFDWFANPRMLFVPAARSPELKAVIAYVRDHLAEATVVGACEAAAMPQRTLHRKCRQELGFGLRTLIREVRIMRAMELLAGREVPVQDAARAVGFASVPSFTAAFTERLGLSPSEYMRTGRAACAAARLATERAGGRPD
jgi:AraC-like DNA-binding protein